MIAKNGKLTIKIFILYYMQGVIIDRFINQKYSGKQISFHLIHIFYHVHRLGGSPHLKGHIVIIMSSRIKWSLLAALTPAGKLLGGWYDCMTG